jgi:iron complex outermembrane receptor protein
MSIVVKPSDPGSRVGLCVLLMIFAAVSPVLADTDDDGQPAESGLVERIIVEASEPRTQTEILDDGPLEMGQYANLAVALETVPGVSGARRSLNGYEPVIRGLGWERVQTQVNGMPIHGACPGRMDPPATTVSRSSLREVAVVKGLSSLTLGPAGTGGRLVLSTDYDRGVGAGREAHAWGRAAYNGVGDAHNLEAGVEGGTAGFDYSVGLEAFGQGDYESGDGTVVPASQTEQGASLSLGGRPTDTQRLFGSVVAQDGEEIDYPSLPMDTDDAETRLYSLGYRFLPSGSGLPSRIRPRRESTRTGGSRNRRAFRPASISTRSSATPSASGTSWPAAGPSTITSGPTFRRTTWELSPSIN